MLPRTLCFFLLIFFYSNFLRSEENHPLLAQEYTLLLKAVASKSDPHHLYSYKMEQEGLISREGKPGHYSYHCLSPNAIMGELTYFSVLRFCNWMENECPSGEENLFTTEKGTYDLSGLINESEDPSLILTPKLGANWLLATNHLVATLSKQLLTKETTIDSSLACSSIGFYIMAPFKLSMIQNKMGSEHLSIATDVNDTSFNKRLISSDRLQKNSPILLSSSFSKASISAPIFLTASNEDLSVKIDMVTINHPYNQSDTIPPRGSKYDGRPDFHYGTVDYVYKIGTYDITVRQYCNFLMAVARIEDPYHLFNNAMETNPNVCSIIKKTNTLIENGVTTTNYTYTVVHGMENYPITCVSYWSAIRFCNWLANGQPKEIGECNLKTTEDGSYYFNDTVPFLRTNTATWRLPTEDEWYKAAYKTPKDDGEYWLYSTGNRHPQNSTRTEDNQPDSPSKNANYCLNGKYTAISSPWITPVGIFSNSPGPWGTYDMGGNVAQLIDDSWTKLKDFSSPTGGTWTLIARGGSWRSTDPLMISAQSGYEYIDPYGTNEGASERIGFRVVCVAPPLPPEKHTLYNTLKAMFHEDLENSYQGNDDALVSSTGYFTGLALGLGLSTGIKCTIEQVAKVGLRGLLFSTEAAIEATTTNVGIAYALTPPGLATCACFAIAYYIYKTNVNDQTPYDANPMMKRTGVGLILYTASSALWMIGRVGWTLML